MRGSTEPSYHQGLRYIDEAGVVHCCDGTPLRDRELRIWDTACRLCLPYATYWEEAPKQLVTCLRCLGSESPMQ